MNIDIYSEYKIYYGTDGCRISQENSTPNDIVFDDFEYDSEFHWRGGKLLLEIVERLNQDYLQDFSIIDNKIKFSYFNYNTGEAEDITMKVEILDKIEEKRIPEKIKYYDDSIAWVIDDVGQLSDVDKVIIDKLNDLLDYLKNKGE